MRAAIYTRVSTEEQAEEGVSLAMQEERCRRLAAERDIGDLTLYCDDGVSGTRYDRPALQEMLAELDDLDIVIIWKLDRLSRSVYDWAHMMELFSRRGVGLVSVTENFDCSSAVGRAMMGMMAVFAQLFVELLRENVSAAIRHNVEHGKHHGVVPFGFVREEGVLQPHPDQAELAYELFERYVSGLSLEALARHANAQRWPAKAKQWDGCKVGRILSNPVYIGKVRYREDYFEGLHDPLVSAELWAQVQSRRRKRRRRAGTPTERWTALYRCGDCGGPMTTRNDDGRACYICKSRFAYPEEERHAPTSAMARPADELVRQWTRRLLTGGVIEEAVSLVAAEIAEEPNADLADLQAELEDVRDQLRDYHRRVSEGSLPAAMLDEFCAPLTERHEYLQARIKRVSTAATPELPGWLNRVRSDFDGWFEALPPSLQVEHLQDLFERVEVHRDGYVTIIHRLPLPPLTVQLPRWIRYKNLPAAVSEALTAALDTLPFQP